MSNTLKTITWEKARTTLAHINPAMTSIIDSLSPPSDLYLYEASYSYGELIDNGSHFNFPDKNNALHCLSQHSDQQLVEDFQYAGNYIPIGIVTDKCVELFVDTGSTIIPAQIFYPGDIFALSLHLEKNKNQHPTPVTQMSSGCRSCFSLPNISDSVHYMQLKRKLNLKTSLPKSLYEQWDFFKNIARARESEQPWQATALLFPQKWVELIKNDPHWQPLYCHLIETAWLKSSYLRNKIYYDYSFNMLTTQRNIKPNPYIAETFKYILAIALGEFPGLRIGIDNSSMPIDVIQEVLLNDYALKHYIPTLVHAARFDYQQSDFATYYSFQFPTVLASINKAKRLTTTLHDLRELKYIYDHYRDAITQKTIGLHDTVVGQMLEQVDLHFLHSKKDIHDEISLSQTVDTFDPHFRHCMPTISNDKSPSYSGAFLRGCIGITNPSLTMSDT